MIRRSCLLFRPRTLSHTNESNGKAKRITISIILLESMLLILSSFGEPTLESARNFAVETRAPLGRHTRIDDTPRSLCKARRLGVFGESHVEFDGPAGGTLLLSREGSVRDRGSRTRNERPIELSGNSIQRSRGGTAGDSPGLVSPAATGYPPDFSRLTRV